MNAIVRRSAQDNGARSHCVTMPICVALVCRIVSLHSPCLRGALPFVGWIIRTCRIDVCACSSTPGLSEVAKLLAHSWSLRFTFLYSLCVFLVVRHAGEPAASQDQAAQAWREAAEAPEAKGFDIVHFIISVCVCERE